jgi:hypothetical protein
MVTQGLRAARKAKRNAPSGARGEARERRVMEEAASAVLESLNVLM